MLLELAESDPIVSVLISAISSYSVSPVWKFVVRSLPPVVGSGDHYYRSPVCPRPRRTQFRSKRFLHTRESVLISVSAALKPNVNCVVSDVLFLLSSSLQLQRQLFFITSFDKAKLHTHQSQQKSIWPLLSVCHFSYPPRICLKL